MTPKNAADRPRPYREGPGAESRARGRVYREKNRAELRARGIAYYAAHREEICARNATRKDERKNHRLKKYGLTLQGFRNLLIRQAGVCAVCGEANFGWHGPIVDHDHTTGKVRGLLCGKCNKGIGLLQDSPTILRLAADHIEAQRSDDDKNSL